MREEAAAEQRGLNRDCIKYIAMVTMFLNHFAHVLLSQETALSELFTNIGYFTAPVMCYFLVEGFAYTHSRKRYALRLFAFALISQVPYTFVLKTNNLNMLFTLFLCFCILAVLDCKKLGIWRTVPVAVLMVASLFMDWAFFAPLFTILFALCKSDKRKLWAAFGVSYILFVLYYHPLYMDMYGQMSWLHGAYAGVGILAAGILLLCFYSGRRARGGRTFSKWFFYIFYPAHIAVLGLAAVFARNFSLWFPGA